MDFSDMLESSVSESKAHHTSRPSEPDPTAVNKERREAVLAVQDPASPPEQMMPENNPSQPANSGRLLATEADVHKSSEGQFRGMMRSIAEHDMFNAIIFLCIALDTVTIGMNDVSVDRDPSGFRAQFIAVSDWVVVVIFTIEMLIKMVAYGLDYKLKVIVGESKDEWRLRDFDALEGSGGYFSLGWNKFDFIIVVLSWVFVLVDAFSVGNSNTSKIVRAFRVVRPLRALRSFEGTQDVLRTFPASIPAMRDVMTLLLFVYFVFAILGTNLFGLSGEFHQRCVVDNDDFGTKGLLMLGHLAYIDPLCGEGFSCGEGFRCSCAPIRFENGTTEKAPFAFADPLNGDHGCVTSGWADSQPNSWGEVCPASGFECFDNFALAMLSTFWTMSLDSWSYRMWWAQDTHGEFIGAVYFVLLVVIIAFNIINLNVAVVSSAYKETRETRKEIEKLREKLKSRAIIRVPEKTKNGIFSVLSNKAKIVLKSASQRPSFQDLPVLNKYARVAKAVSTYPSEIDERGCLVPVDLVSMAARRGVRILYGPAKAEWRLQAGPKGCQKRLSRGSDAHSSESGASDDAHRGTALTFSAGAIIETGVSHDESKESLRVALRGFQEISDKEGPQLAERKTAYLDVMVLSLILANTFCMACDHYDGRPVLFSGNFSPEDHCCDSLCLKRNEEHCPRGMIIMSESWKTFLFFAECVFNVLFTIETSIRLVAAWSLRTYLTENFPSNAVDLVIVLISDVVFILDLFNPSLIKVSIFRLLRVMRAFRLLSRFRRLQVLLNNAVASFKTILHVLFVLIFWVVVFALLGIQLFRCDVRNDDLCSLVMQDECPEGCSMNRKGICYFTEDEMFGKCPWSVQHNFNSMDMSVIELVYVLTGENWVQSMQNGMRSTSSVWPGLIFFLTYYIVAFYMLFNLIIGVILEEFELEDQEKNALQMGKLRAEVLKQLRRNDKEQLKQMKTGQGEAGSRRDFDSSNSLERFDDGELSENSDDVVNKDDSLLCFCLPPATPNKEFPDSPINLRGYAKMIENSPWFERCILLAIFVSAVLIGLDSPIPSFANVSPSVVLISDYVFLVIFFLEFLVKILHSGIYFESDGAYFKSSWNIIDFIILTSQFLDVFQIVHELKPLRAIRVVRPLRLLNKFKSLQLLLLSIRSSTADMLNVLLLWMFAFAIFAIVGVNLFAGKLYRCNDFDFTGPVLNPGVEDSSVGFREGCVGAYFTFVNDAGESYVSDDLPTGIFRPRVWANPTDSASGMGFNFDNFGSAIQTLFEVSTFEMWSDVMIRLMDTTSMIQQPISMSQVLNVVYLHAWVILSCCFVLQLVIGVLIDAINQKSGTSLRTNSQRNWIAMRERIKKLKPLDANTEPINPVRRTIYRFVSSFQFQGVITFVIMTNILLMSTESYDQSEWWTEAMSKLNTVFVVIYLVEIVLKLLAFLHEFFLDPWNLFDVTVVVASLAETLMGGNNPAGIQALRAIRILKVFRALRLVRRAKRLCMLISALLESIPPIMSSLVFFCLFIFFFASAGVQFFAGVRHGQGINRRNNFHDAMSGALALFRVSTGENWETVMRDCAIEPPFCTTNEEAQQVLGDPLALGDCGSAIGSILFFDIVFLLGNNILLNLFVAVLLENFFNFQMQDTFVLSSEHLVSYQKRWGELDVEKRGWMPVSKLRELIENLLRDKNPLGVVVLSNELKFRSVRMEVIEGKAQGQELVFSDLAFTLALHVVGSHGLPYADMLKRQEMLAQYARMASVSKLTHVYRSISQDKDIDIACRNLRDNEGERLPSRESFGGQFESNIHPAAINGENVDEDSEGVLEACLNVELNSNLDALMRSARGRTHYIRAAPLVAANIPMPRDG